MIQFLKKHLYSTLIIVLFGLILFINYYDVLKFHYFVPPGNDPVAHISIVKEILEKGKAPAPGYPPGFHYVVAGLSKIFNTNPIKTIVYFYPFLMFLSALAIYLFARQFFGKAVAILALFLAGYITHMPRQTLWDGGFPDVITANCIMIFGFMFFLRAYKYEKWRDVFLAGLFLGAVPFFHHLSSYLMVNIIIVTTFGLIIFSKFAKDNPKKKLVILGTIWILIILIGVYPAYIYFGKGYLQQISSTFIAHAASLKGFILRSTSLNSEAPPPQWADYALFVSPFVWYLGLLSIPFLLKNFLKNKKAEYLFVFLWVAIVFILSRPVFFSPLPGRFTRELTIPLIFCSAIFIKEVLVFFKPFLLRAILAMLIAIFLIKGLFVWGAFAWVGKYNPMIFVRNLDKQALDFVSQNTPANAKFAVAPFNIWFGLMTDKQFSNIGTDFTKISNYDYLYINRWQNDWMWGPDSKPYIKIRSEVAGRQDLQLIKTFGEENEQGIAIYKINK